MPDDTPHRDDEPDVPEEGDGDGEGIKAVPPLDSDSDFAALADHLDPATTGDDDRDPTEPTNEPGTPSSDRSAFSDLVERISGGRTDTAEGSQQSLTGRLGRLEEIGLLDPDSASLLLADAGGEAEHDSCVSILTCHPPEDVNLLLVWLTRSTGSRFDRLTGAWDAPPARLGLVGHPEVVGASDRRTWAADAAIHPVDDPSNLTQLGITISKVVSGWSEPPERTIVCIDTVSELLRHNDQKRVFRFLHVLLGRLNTVEATAHFHLDTRTHDLQTIRTLQSLFDVTIEVDGDGITRLD